MAAAVIGSVVRALGAEADRQRVPFRSLATTLSCALASPRWTWVLQVGDGATAIRPAGGAAWAIAAWPERGEYANSTHFLTDDEVRWQSSVGPSASALAAITDGLVPLALDLAGRRAFAPFFDGIASELAAHEPAELAPHLALLLRSPRVTDRTDDDVTIVIAVRAAAHRRVPHAPA